MEKIKVNTIGGGIIVLLIGLLFFGISFLFVMDPSKYLVSTKSYLIWAFLLIFSLIAFDMGFVLIRGGSKISESNLEYDTKNIWSKIGFVKQYLEILSFILGIFVISFFFYLFTKIFYNKIVFSFTPAFFILIAVCIIYSFVRFPIKKSVLNFSGKTLPSYTLEKDGIVLDLKIKNLENLSKKYIVKIKFKEIEEIKVLSMVEAQGFLNYKVGPNLELAIAQIKDVANYMKGKIERPRYYYLAPYVLGKKSLFIRGKNLFYLFAVSNDDVSDLTKAFSEFKKTK